MSRGAGTTLIRRGVVGHTGIRFAESFSWKSDELPNLADFKVLIVDLRTLQPNSPLKADDVLQQVRIGLHRQVKAGGTAAVIVDRPLRKLSLPGRNHPFEIRHAIPVNGDFRDETGRSIDIVNNRFFPEYLASFREFHFHFSGLTDAPVYGSAPNNPLAVEPICVNHEKHALAALVRIGRGVLHILPHVPAFPLPSSIELIFEGLTGTRVKGAAPEWVQSVHVHGVSALNSAIAEREAKIGSIRNEIEQLDSKRNELLEYVELIYADGKQPEGRVKKALELLGGTVRPAEFSEEEYILSFEDRDYVIEVKGVAKSAQLEHVGQAVQHALTAEQRSRQEVGALLVVNAWKTSPPAERTPPRKPPIPDNVAKRATMYKLPILTGVQLLDAVNSALADRNVGPMILRRVLSSAGPVEPAAMEPPSP